MGAGESRLQLRQQALRLMDKDVISFGDTEFWSTFWKYPESMEDVLNLLSITEIRHLRDESSDNFLTLTTKLVNRLEELSLKGSVQDSSDISAILNCIRILSRILPFFFEVYERDKEHVAPSEHSIRLSKFFWTSAENNDVILPSPSETLGARLCASVKRCLFLPGFAVSISFSSSTKKTSPEASSPVAETYFPVWAGGIGITKAGSGTWDENANRIETLRLLLVLLGQKLYEKSPSNVHHPNEFWYCLVNERNLVFAQAILLSLLNVIIQYEPSGWIPYGYALSSDIRGPFTVTCLHTLIALLDCRTHDLSSGSTIPHPHAIEVSSVNAFLPAFRAETDTMWAVPDMNIYVNLLSRLHQGEDLSKLSEAFVRLFNNPIRSTRTILPSSMKSIEFSEELLISIWLCLGNNRRLLRHVASTDRALELVVPLVYFSLENRKSETHIGLLHLSGFTLLILSSDREFCVRLNKPFTSPLKFDLPTFHGTYADFLILTLHRLITNSQTGLSGLHNCLLTTIANISPYVKSLSMVTATRLLALFYHFSSGSQLIESDAQLQMVSLLLETFNNCIQYQYGGSLNLIYGILRRPNPFLELHNLSAEQFKTSLLARDVRSGLLEGASSQDSCSLPKTESNDQKGLSVVPPPSGDPSVTVNESPQNEPVPIAPTESDAGIRMQNLEKRIMEIKTSLPLQPIVRLLQVLLPQIERLCDEIGVTDESEIMAYLRENTLVGLLPAPHPILVRKYQSNEVTNTWLTNYIWSVIYLRNSDRAVWYGTHIRLFRIRSTIVT